MDIKDHIINNSLAIIVRPNSPKNEITGYDESRKAVKVNIKAPAEDNKANAEVIKFFSKETKKDVKIITGRTNKRKVLKFS
jgi:uncharacterized protein (TIGR00251 family)